MVMAFNLKLKDTPFQQIHHVPLPIAPEIPFNADSATVDMVRFCSGRLKISASPAVPLAI